MTTTAKLLGIDESVTRCDCCGRSNLKLTVVLDVGGEVVHYGRDCAGAALFGRRKNRKDAEITEKRARAVRFARMLLAETDPKARDAIEFRISQIGYGFRVRPDHVSFAFDLGKPSTIVTV